MLLREVLITLTNISTATIKTLMDLSNGKDTSTQTVNSEISRLQASVEATTGLIAFYEQKLHQEAEKGVLGRHMEDAKVLTDAIRALRHDEQPMGNQHDPRPNNEIQNPSTTVVEYRIVDSSSVNYPVESSDLSPNILENLRKQMEGHVGTIAAYRTTTPIQTQSIYGSSNFKGTTVVGHLPGASVSTPATLAAASRHRSFECGQEIPIGGASQLRRTRSTPFGGSMKTRIRLGREDTSHGSRLPSVQEASSLKGGCGWDVGKRSHRN